MKARMKNPAMIITDAMGPLQGLGKTLAASTIPEMTRTLMHIRISQINGCASCLDGEIGKTQDTAQRLAAIAVWREAPFFSDAERAALDLAEAITRLADQSDRVSDAVWSEAARHYDETALAWLVLDASVLNLYNRLNVATRQVAGQRNW
jgi:AhpD family alkylhydroperoxidase